MFSVPSQCHSYIFGEFITGIYPVSDHLLHVTSLGEGENSNYKHGIADFDGHILVEAVYNHISFEDGILVATVNEELNQRDYYDENGQLLMREPQAEYYRDPVIYFEDEYEGEEPEASE